MPERVIGTYLIRFTEDQQQQAISLHNLKTGERIEFETWVAAWVFLEGWLHEHPAPRKGLSG
jgi:hypothetical protein